MRRKSKVVLIPALITARFFSYKPPACSRRSACKDSAERCEKKKHRGGGVEGSLLSPSASLSPYFFLALSLRAALHYLNTWNRLTTHLEQANHSLSLLTLRSHDLTMKLFIAKNLLAYATATAAKTSVKKWTRAFSNFINLISFHLICQMLGNFSGVNSKRTVPEIRKRKRKLSNVRRFHVAVVQQRQRNVQKSVLHVQSCCFANLNLTYCFFVVLVAVPVVVA